MNQVIHLAFALIVFATASNAATLRYEFDVVDSSIKYGRVQKDYVDLGDLEQDPGVGTTQEEIDTFTAEFHPLRDAIGATGSVVLELVEDLSLANSMPYDDYDRKINCISGLLCDGFGNLVHQESYGTFVKLVPADTVGGPVGQIGWRPTCCREWLFNGEEELSYYDDDEPLGNRTTGEGSGYSFYGVFGTFQLANVQITEIPSVPLPWTLPMLSAGFASLIFWRRKKTL